MLLFDEFQLVETIGTLKDQMLIPIKLLQDKKVIHAVLTFGTYSGMTAVAGNPMEKVNETKKEKKKGKEQVNSLKSHYSPF